MKNRKIMNAKKLTIPSLLYMMLFSTALLINACKKEDNSLPNNKVNQHLLQKGKEQFELGFLNKTNNFNKNINLVPIWEKAITDNQGNIRVPLNFGLKNGNKIGKLDDSFELFVKNIEGAIPQVNIIHFIKIGKDTYSEVLKLNGERLKHIRLSNKNDLLQKEQHNTKSGKAIMSGGGTSPTDLVEYFSVLYEKPAEIVVLLHCPQGLLFSPVLCACVWPDDVDEGAKDKFILVVFVDGSVVFCPAEIFLDTVIIYGGTDYPTPEYPNEPAFPGSDGNTDPDGGYKPSGGNYPPASGSEPAPLDAYRVANATVFDNGKPKIPDIKKYTDCFKDGKTAQSYTMTIYVDQPVSGEGDWYRFVKPGVASNNLYNVPTGIVFTEPDGTFFDVGHTFVTFEKNNTDGTNVRQTLGFYPKGSNFGSQGAFENNSGHNADVSYKIDVTKAQFEAALKKVESDATKQYRLDNLNGTEYNCTDAAISWMNAAGASFGNSSFGLFKNTPGSFGQVLRGLPNAYKNPTSGIWGKGSCN